MTEWRICDGDFQNTSPIDMNLRIGLKILCCVIPAEMDLVTAILFEKKKKKRLFQRSESGEVSKQVYFKKDCSNSV